MSAISDVSTGTQHGAGPALLFGVDPRTGEPVGPGVRVAGPAEAVAAAEAAAGALRARPAPGEQGGFDDADLLEAVAHALATGTDELVAVAGRETGLGAERLRAEVARTTGQLRAFAAARRDGLLADAIIDLARPATGGAAARPDQRRVAQPIGPVAVFAASNFPFAFSTAGGDTAAAFAAGCPVVLKAHPAHPQTSQRTSELVRGAVAGVGAPAAWFQVLHGPDAALGRALATAPAVAAVAFTGSLQAGRALFDAAAARPEPVPVFAEMGSTNPVAITPAALARRGAELGAALAAAVLGSAGQLCTKPNLVLAVDGPGLTELVEALAAGLRESDELVMLTNRLRDSFGASWRALLASGAAREHVTATTPDRAGAWQAPGLATVPAATLIARSELVEEHFGPGVVVAVASDADELLALAQRLPGSLTATVHAELDEPDKLDEIENPDADRGDGSGTAWAPTRGGGLAQALARTLAERAGRLIWNGLPTGVTVGHATVHGGPYPATTASASTSVGLTAARRFQRPVGYQGWPDVLLPPELRDANPLGIVRLLDGTHTRAAVER